MAITREVADLLLTVPESMDRILLPHTTTDGHSSPGLGLDAHSFTRRKAFIPLLTFVRDHSRKRPERGDITIIEGVECLAYEVTEVNENLLIRAWVEI